MNLHPNFLQRKILLKKCVKVKSVEIFFSAIHTVWTLWSCICHEFKDTFEENSLNEYFKTVSHYFRVKSLSGFIWATRSRWKHWSFFFAAVAEVQVTVLSVLHIDQDFQLVHSGTVVFAARCLPQKYFAIRRAFRQHKLTLETQGDAAAARKRSHQWRVYPECTMTSSWMASLGFVYGLLLGNCGYQTDRKIYDQSASHSACDKLSFARGRENYQSSADEVAFLLALTIAVMLPIIIIICFVMGWIFTALGFSVLISYLLGIAVATALTIFWWLFVLFIVFVPFVCTAVKPDDSRTGEYIGAISVSYMIAYLYF